MQFLVQMKIVAQGRATSLEARITLVENYFFPSLEVQETARNGRNAGRVDRHLREGERW